MSIALRVNGELRQVCASVTLSGLIATMDIKGRYAVEVNGKIIAKSCHGQFTFVDGDVIEIVIAVGGG
jgi:thiamine biosynthesis protein ThiS